MTPKTWFSLVSVLLMLFAVVGCGGAPATPTKPPVTVPPVPTLAPTLPPPPTATLAPTPTESPTITPTVAVTVPVAKATSAPVARTRTPTRPAATKAPTALPLKFAAPRPVSPIFVNESGGQKDERHFPGDALTFNWMGVGGLGGDECYLLHVEMVPTNAAPGVGPRGDDFLVRCGDQTGAGAIVGKADSPSGSFTLYQPSRGSPNYGALLPDAAEMWVYWTVTVVKDLGLKADKVHHNTAPLSPSSNKVQFLLKG